MKGFFDSDHAIYMLPEPASRLILESELEALSIYFERTWPVSLADLCFFGTSPKRCNDLPS